MALVVGKYYELQNQQFGTLLNLYGNHSGSTIPNGNKISLYSRTNNMDQQFRAEWYANAVKVTPQRNAGYVLNRHSGDNSVIAWPGASASLDDTEIDFITINAAQNLYRLKLSRLNLYLTATGSQGICYWRALNGSNTQVFKLLDPGSGGGVTNGYTYPTSSRTLSQGYSSSNHPAIDIPGNGMALYAFADGKVAFTQNSPTAWHPDDLNPPYSSGSMQSMGHCIAINHNNPDSSKASGSYARTIYMHLNAAPTLPLGTSVKKGDIIGYSGATGRRTGPHLHFCLAVGNLSSMSPGQTGWVSIASLPKIDPRTYLPDYH